MDAQMEDVGVAPTDTTTTQAEVAQPTIPELDGWIGGLLDCKQLPEESITRLCSKVRRHRFVRHMRGWKHESNG